jgi:hypothetical protein
VDTCLPSKFAAGTTVEYTRTTSDYPADQGWTLTLMIRGAAILDKLAVAVGADHKVTLTATDTSALTEGVYQYVEQVTHVTLGTFNLADPQAVEVTPNFATAEAGDLLDIAVKTLKIIRDILSGKIDDLKRYEIGGRSAELFTHDELIRAEDYWRRRVDSLKPGQRGKIDSGVRAVITGGLRA